MNAEVVGRDDGGNLKYGLVAGDDGELLETDGDVLDPSTKAEVTKKARKHLNGLENRLESLVGNATRPSPPSGSSDGDSENEDVVVHFTDSHIGRTVEDEYGKEIFTPDIAVARVTRVTEKALRLVERQRNAQYGFDKAHLLLGGDMIDGETVYNNQPFEITLTLDEQLNLAASTYMGQIKAFADEFEEIQVVCQQGNHGSFGGDSASEAANADRVLYLMLENMVQQSGLSDRVDFVRNSSSQFTNFRVRGHRGHLRHGDGSRPHIGTSSAEKDWRGWKLEHRFDVAYWGHHHEPEYDEVSGSPVIRTGTIMPGGDFEEGLSLHGGTSGTVHGVSNERPLTWLYHVDFDE
jgi:hypothetical protein